MQTSCRQTSSERASTSGRSTAIRHCGCPTLVHAVYARSKHSNKLRKDLLLTDPSSQALRRTSLPHPTAQQGQRHICLRAREQTSSTSDGSNKGPVIVIDNYDSFTYNICQYLGDLGCEHIVFKNDEKTIDELRALNPRGILLSPGPGRPEDSGIALQTVRELGPDFPIFGVCMGHQCIGQVFGGDVVQAPSGVMHGKTSPVHHNGTGLLKGLSNPFLAARYHSLVIAKDSVPDDLEVTAWTEDGTIMAVQHKKYPQIQGVQFHPESIITDNGRQVVQNFIESLT
ncbi:Ankyrin repeat and SOCS box protein 2 [Trebouxia sp. C0009 RCD-2024]